MKMKRGMRRSTDFICNRRTPNLSWLSQNRTHKNKTIYIETIAQMRTLDHNISTQTHSLCMYLSWALSFLYILIQNWKIIEKMTFQIYPPRMKIKLFWNLKIPLLHLLIGVTSLCHGGMSSLFLQRGPGITRIMCWLLFAGTPRTYFSDLSESFPCVFLKKLIKQVLIFTRTLQRGPGIMRIMCCLLFVFTSLNYYSDLSE